MFLLVISCLVISKKLRPLTIKRHFVLTWSPVFIRQMKARAAAAFFHDWANSCLHVCFLVPALLSTQRRCLGPIRKVICGTHRCYSQPGNACFLVGPSCRCRPLGPQNKTQKGISEMRKGYSNTLHRGEQDEEFIHMTPHPLPAPPTRGGRNPTSPSLHLYHNLLCS